MRLRYSTGPALVAPNQCGVRVSNSAASPGLEDEVVLAEDQPERAVEHVDPVVALVGPQAGYGVVVSGRALALFRQWTGDLRYFSNGLEPSAEEQAKLAAVGIPVVDGRVTRLEAGDEHALGVRLDDGRVVEVDVVAVASRMVARADVFAGIGIEAAGHPMGSYIAAGQAGRTAVPGVWVAGNTTDLSAQVSAASADGARVGAQLNADLVYEDTDRAVARLAGAGATR